MYDIIGDIHGHAQELKSLLHQLGYEPQGHEYSHPSRKLVFLGDYIDRGPRNLEVIRIVKATVDAGNAFAIMGNHEYNAIAYHTSKGEDEYFRPHSKKNQQQHEAFIGQLSCYEMCEALDWFRTLPVAIELEGINVVHASWQHQDIESINQAREELGDFNESFLAESEKKGSDLNLAIERVLKGPEVQLPAGKSFVDKGGHKRTASRVKWWKRQAGEQLSDYLFGILDMQIPTDLVKNIHDYPLDADPVFFGHYWLTSEPEPLAPNVACLDYSVAKDGKLCAYHWGGERELKTKNFVWVNSEDPCSSK